VAAVLAGAWRRTPPALDLPASTLAAVAPTLAVGGAGALAWHRLRETPLRFTSVCRELRQHYRLQTLQALDREEAIRVLLVRLRAAGTEPILIKGWSSARLYPEPALRPVGDVDLCVPPDQLSAAATLLSAAPLPCPVDLHAGVPDLPDRRWDDVYRRARLVALGDAAVRVLGPEDQLRLLCLHLARHGFARPLWLCDVGAWLEQLPADFDWDCFRRGDKHLTAWASCVLGLAGRFLGAHTDGVPFTVERTPPWVERAVLWCWGAGRGRPPRHYLRHPAEIVRRWRYHGFGRHPGSTPVKAALQLGLGPVRWLPLLLVQLAAFARRKGIHVLTRLVRPRRGRHPVTIHRH
jgi:hypothetical protein